MNFFLPKIDMKNIARCKKLNSLQFLSPVTLHNHLEIEGGKGNTKWCLWWLSTYKTQRSIEPYNLKNCPPVLHCRGLEKLLHT